MSGDAEGPPKVVIVEDEEALADLYTKFLKDRFDTETVYDGETALETIDNRVDIVLLDRRMPKLSGDEVLRRLKGEGYDGQVIMVTAAHPDFEIVEIGFDNYIVKPIDREALVDVVERTLAQGTYEDRLREYYQVSAKIDHLERRLTAEQRATSSEYQELSSRLNRIRSKVDELLEDIDGPGFTAAVERTQTVAVLQESEERFRSMTEDVLDTSDVGTVIVDADGRVEWITASMEEFFQLDREAILQQRYEPIVTERLAPNVCESEAFVDRLVAAQRDNDGVQEFQVNLESGAAGVGWLKHWSKPIETGLFAGGRIEHYYDITALKRREETLDALHTATRELIDAESAEVIAELVAECGTEILGAAAAGVYLRDGSSGELRLSASAGRADSDPPRSTITPADEAVWTTFVEGGRRVIEAGDSPFPGDDHSVAIRSMGGHGILVLAFPGDGGPPESMRPFADVLVANTEVTLDRGSRERALRERDEKLERQNEQLRRLNRMHTAIRTISQGLIDASTRPEIEETVCDRLSRVDSIRFVWMGEPDIVNQELTPTAWAGEESGYLDVIPTDFGDDTEEAIPGVRVAESRSPETVNNLLEASAAGEWRAEALSRGFQSVVAIPVMYESSLFGVIELYADQPFVFGEDEGEVLAELGLTIGHGINAINRRDALLADNLVALEFALEGDGAFFDTVATEVGAVRLRAMIPDGSGDYVVFFVVEAADTGTVADLAAPAADVQELHPVREGDEDALFKATVSAPTAATIAADNGAIPTDIRADGDGIRLEVLVPRSTDVRSFQRRLVEQGLEADLVARRQRKSDESVKQALNERIEASLTDRQRESLQSAYFSGYFDWPREANGREVAEALGIDQSTFQQHLRAGQRHVLETLFDTV